LAFPALGFTIFTKARIGVLRGGHEAYPKSTKPPSAASAPRGAEGTSPRKGKRSKKGGFKNSLFNNVLGEGLEKSSH
jgi:hypothetical protein